MIVLDTNVISEAMSTSPDPSFSAWLSKQPGSQVFTTTVNLAEILYGIELLPADKRRSDLLFRAEAMFTSLFMARILAFDEASARAFPGIAVERRRRGRPITVFDTQIAAIARAHSAILATRNTADFEGCGIRLVNPWVD